MTPGNWDALLNWADGKSKTTPKWGRPIDTREPFTAGDPMEDE